MLAPNRTPDTEGVRSRLSSLTSLRFFAALLVFLCHAGFVAFFNQPAYRSDFVSAVNRAGAVGVSFFFVLSGFVLAWSARKGDTTPRFWRRRLFKIYPMHVITFVLAMVVTAWSTATWGTSLMNLFLVQTWVPRADIADMVNIPSWSLSCELLFYLSFPVLFRVLKKVRAEHLWRWAGGLTAAIILVPLVARLLPGTPLMAPMGGPIGKPGSQWETWFVYAFPPVRLLEFALGIVMALIVVNGRWVKIPVTALLGLTAAAYVVALHAPYGFSLVAVSIIPVALLIPATASIDTEARRSILQNRVLVQLGEISFAFYMVHTIVMAEFGKLITQGALGTWATTGLIALDLVVSLAASWVLYTFVERPIMRHWAGSRKVRTAPVEAAPEVVPAPEHAAAAAA